MSSTSSTSMVTTRQTPSRATTTRAPEGKGPKVKLVCHNGKWVHAMKQQADGKWGSKNGASSRYKDVNNCNKFASKHYPNKKMTTICYCRK
jgi:hypothetical protein